MSNVTTQVVFEQAHKWRKIEGTQVPDIEPNSFWVCSVCKLNFTHWYHQEPSIYKAIADAGINGSICIIPKGKQT